MHFCVGIHIRLRGDRHPVFEETVESSLESLAKVGTHEGVDYRINAGVAVRHAVRPYLHFVSVVVLAEVRAKGLHQDEKLDRTPAQNKQLHDHQNHSRHFSPHSSTVLGLNLQLRRVTKVNKMIVSLQ